MSVAKPTFVRYQVLAVACSLAGMTLAGLFLKSGQHYWMFSVFAASYVLAALCWFAVDVTKPIVPRQCD